MWTKAHVGTISNEKADELAKAGAVGQNRIEVGMPKCEIKSKVEEYFYKQWSSDFVEYKGARMGKLFYKEPDKDKAKYVLKLSRIKLARFVRIISGHNSLSYFRNKVDEEVDPRCRFCEEEKEDFEHLVNDCPRFHEDRKDKFLGQIVTNDHMWSVQTLLDFSYLPGINEALGGSFGQQTEQPQEIANTESSTETDDSTNNANNVDSN